MKNRSGRLNPRLLTLGEQVPGAPMTSDAIPDFSATARARVPEAFKWRIEDIFPDEPAWRAGFAQAQDLAASLDPLARVWTASPPPWATSWSAWSR